MKKNLFGWEMKFNPRLWAGLGGDWPVCPKCGSVDTVYQDLPTGSGTGPGGRHRLGDPYVTHCVCGACGHRSTKKDFAPTK